MEAFVTVLAALIIASPFVVLALRTTRWDPVAPPHLRRVLDERDADARRAALDDAATAARQVDTAARVPDDAARSRAASSARRAAPRTARPGAPRLG